MGALCCTEIAEDEGILAWHGKEGEAVCGVDSRANVREWDRGTVDVGGMGGRALG